MTKWLSGKRTYLVVAAIVAVSILNACEVQLPEYVWTALAAAGLGFLRAGIKKAES